MKSTMCNSYHLYTAFAFPLYFWMLAVVFSARASASAELISDAGVVPSKPLSERYHSSKPDLWVRRTDPELEALLPKPRTGRKLSSASSH